MKKFLYIFGVFILPSQAKLESTLFSQEIELNYAFAEDFGILNNLSLEYRKKYYNFANDDMNFLNNMDKTIDRNKLNDFIARKVGQAKNKAFASKVCYVALLEYLEENNSDIFEAINNEINKDLNKNLNNQEEISSGNQDNSNNNPQIQEVVKSQNQQSKSIESSSSSTSSDQDIISSENLVKEKTLGGITPTNGDKTKVQGQASTNNKPRENDKGIISSVDLVEEKTLGGITPTNGDKTKVQVQASTNNKPRENDKGIISSVDLLKEKTVGGITPTNDDKTKVQGQASTNNKPSANDETNLKESNNESKEEKRLEVGKALSDLYSKDTKDAFLKIIKALFESVNLLDEENQKIAQPINLDAKEIDLLQKIKEINGIKDLIKHIKELEDRFRSDKKAKNHYIEKYFKNLDIVAIDIMVDKLTGNVDKKEQVSKFVVELRKYFPFVIKKIQVDISIEEQKRLEEVGKALSDLYSKDTKEFFSMVIIELFNEDIILQNKNLTRQRDIDLLKKIKAIDGIKDLINHIKELEKALGTTKKEHYYIKRYFDSLDVVNAIVDKDKKEFTQEMTEKMTQDNGKKEKVSEFVVGLRKFIPIVSSNA